MILGVPTGNMQERWLSILSFLEMNLDITGREYSVKVPYSQIIKEIRFFTSAGMPASVVDGKVDLAFTGLDRLRESGKEKEVELIAQFNIGKKLDRAVDVILFHSGDKKLSELMSKWTITIYSEYPNITLDEVQGHFPRHVLNIIWSPEDEDKVDRFKKNVLIYPSDGGTESKVTHEEYDFGVCVAETRKTAEDNGLIIDAILLVSPQVLIARKRNSLETVFAEAVAEAISRNTERLLWLKFNVDSKATLDKVLEFIPSVKSPTINHRADGEFAVETLIPKTSFFDTYMKLLLLKEASGITTEKVGFASRVFINPCETIAA